MKVAVRIIFPRSDVGMADISYEIEAPSVADGICMSFDRLEADGATLSEIGHFAVVAKAGAGAESMLSVEHTHEAARAA